MKLREKIKEVVEQFTASSPVAAQPADPQNASVMFAGMRRGMDEANRVLAERDAERRQQRIEAALAKPQIAEEPVEDVVIEARVRVHNTYGDAPAGTIVQVSRRELATVRHCLVSLDDEQRELAAITEAARLAEVERVRRKDNCPTFDELKVQFALKNFKRPLPLDDDAKNEWGGK